MELNQRIKDYWEGEAKVYAAGIEEELEGFQRNAWKNIIFENAPQKGKMNILDIGTGPGFFPIILGEEGHAVTGIDITENMILHAKENLIKEGVEAELQTMDCQKLSFADEQFDLVVCRNLTWTIDNPVEAYKEWFRVLKKGGRLLVFDACWYMYLYDEKIREQYHLNEQRIKEKYGRGIHAHNDLEEGDALAKKLFMSDKKRPAWDLSMMIEIGFSKVFSSVNIMDRVWNEIGKEINGVTPQFMVGGEK